jgi:hypothetical protein
MDCLKLTRSKHRKAPFVFFVLFVVVLLRSEPEIVLVPSGCPVKIETTKDTKITKIGPRPG